MGRFSDILLTVDYDRTLTAPDSTIPERNLRAIRYFMEHGGVFTVNTGRSVPMSRQLMAQVPVNAPFLLYNGSAAYDQGRLVQLHPIRLEMEQTLREVSRRFPDTVLELQGVDAHYCFRENPDWDHFCESLGCRHAHASYTQDLGPFLKFTLYIGPLGSSVAELFQGTSEDIARLNSIEAWLKENWGEQITVLRPAPRIIDIHASGVSKNQAARELQARLGRKILVCVGDAENDLSMLTGADYAFCPSDGIVANRFPNVCPCAEGAVADVIFEKIPEILGFALDKNAELC